MNLFFLFTIFLIFSVPLFRLSADDKICNRIYLVDGKLTLNANEKKLICGDPQGPNGWRTISLAQAEKELQLILQNMGYYKSEVTRDGENSLKIKMGPRSIIKSFAINSKEKLPLKVKKKRKLIGHPMVSFKLNEVEDWAYLGTQSIGYACAKHELVANAMTGHLEMTSTLGPKKRFERDVLSDIKDFDVRILRRHMAFRVGDRYDIRKIQITTNRMLNSGLFQSAFFLDNCVNDQFDLRLETSIGKPNIFRFGIGASTEELPFLNLTYRNSNIGKKASSYTLTLNYSPRLKSLSLDSELFVLPRLWQIYLSPRVRFAQESEDAYEVNNARAGVDTAFVADMFNTRITGRIGPAFNSTQTLRGDGPDNLNYVSLEGSLQFMSLDYEYGLREQTSGWLINLFYRNQRQQLGSQLGLDHFKFTVKNLWNINNYSPAFLVLGTRAELTVTDIENPTDENLSKIPFDDRVFLGGDQSLRGFNRLSVDNNGLGYLTSLYVGLELRLVETFPYNLQPFLLYDFAQLGEDNLRFDSATLASEGFGVRWASPFGTLRTSLAKGRVLSQAVGTKDYKEEWIWFFSFGQEF